VPKFATPEIQGKETSGMKTMSSRSGSREGEKKQGCFRCVRMRLTIALFEKGKGKKGGDCSRGETVMPDAKVKRLRKIILQRLEGGRRNKRKLRGKTGQGTLDQR